VITSSEPPVFVTVTVLKYAYPGVQYPKSIGLGENSTDGPADAG
jgi:hypothetical protein